MTLVGAVCTLLVLPGLSSAGLAEDLQRGVRQTLDPVAQTLERILPPAQRSGPKRQVAPSQPAAAPPSLRQTPGQGTYQPPLHGADPHGQGSLVVGDISPSDTRPLSGDPTGSGDSGQDREEVVVGRARGEQRPDGSYHGHITIVSLLGNELLGVDTGPDQTAAGPLDPLQTGVLDEICTASSICLDVLRADSATTASGSTNSFAVARAGVGGASGINVTAAEANGNVSQDASCQASHGDTTVANVTAGGSGIANAASSSTDSNACNDGTQSQQHASQAIGLFGTPVPLPAAGCGDGTPDSAFTPLTPLLSIVCNADDSSGTGEALAQAGVPYGVREALGLFVLETGGGALLKVSASGSESRATAPGPAPAPPTTPAAPDDGGDDGGPGGPDRPREDDGDGDGGDGRDGGGEPECSDGIDNDGDGRIDFPDDPQCSSREDDSEADGAGATTGGPDDRLPVTGAELLLIALLGSLALAGGLALRRVAERGEGQHSA